MAINEGPTAPSAEEELSARECARAAVGPDGSARAERLRAAVDTVRTEDAGLLERLGQ